MRYYPKNYYWVKMHKGRRLSFINGKLIRSRFGLVACSYGLITQRQFETIRRFIARRIRKKSKYFRRTSLDLSTTKKSSKARMGKGCGRFFRWLGYIRPGMVIFEINEISSKDKKNALRTEFQSLMTKLPFRVRLKERTIVYKSI